MGMMDTLRGKFPGAVLGGHAHRGDDTVIVKAGHIVEVCAHLRQECGFNMLTDLTAVDYLHYPAGAFDPAFRFEVVYHLYSLSSNARVRIKCPLPGDAPAIDTVVPVWAGANWLEREVYDMFGISFTGHPDPRRILMYDGFDGHPLRKDYPFRKRQPLVPYRDNVPGATPPGGEVRKPPAGGRS